MEPNKPLINKAAQVTTSAGPKTTPEHAEETKTMNSGNRDQQKIPTNSEVQATTGAEGPIMFSNVKSIMLKTQEQIMPSGLDASLPKDILHTDLQKIPELNGSEVQAKKTILKSSVPNDSQNITSAREIQATRRLSNIETQTTIAGVRDQGTIREMENISLRNGAMPGMLPICPRMRVIHAPPYGLVPYPYEMNRMVPMNYGRQENLLMPPPEYFRMQMGGRRDFENREVSWGRNIGRGTINRGRNLNRSMGYDCQSANSTPSCYRNTGPPARGIENEKCMELVSTGRGLQSCERSLCEMPPQIPNVLKIPMWEYEMQKTKKEDDVDTKKVKDEKTKRSNTQINNELKNKYKMIGRVTKEREKPKLKSSGEHGKKRKTDAEFDDDEYIKRKKRHKFKGPRLCTSICDPCECLLKKPELISELVKKEIEKNISLTVVNNNAKKEDTAPQEDSSQIRTETSDNKPKEKEINVPLSTGESITTQIKDEKNTPKTEMVGNAVTQPKSGSILSLRNSSSSKDLSISSLKKKVTILDKEKDVSNVEEMKQIFSESKNTEEQKDSPSKQILTGTLPKRKSPQKLQKRISPSKIEKRSPARKVSPSRMSPIKTPLKQKKSIEPICKPCMVGTQTDAPIRPMMKTSGSQTEWADSDKEYSIASLDSSSGTKIKNKEVENYGTFDYEDD